MYCSAEDLQKYVFHKYLVKIEELAPGTVENHINGVSQEIDDALRPRFRLPLSQVPATIKRIAEVMAAYRCVGAITTMMRSEAPSENEWIPLQTQYKEVRKLLELIAEGKMDLGLEALGNETDNPLGDIVVKAPKQRFDDKFWRKF